MLLPRPILTRRWMAAWEPDLHNAAGTVGCNEVGSNFSKLFQND